MSNKSITKLSNAKKSIDVWDIAFEGEVADDSDTDIVVGAVIFKNNEQFSTEKGRIPVGSEKEFFTAFRDYFLKITGEKAIVNFYLCDKGKALEMLVIPAEAMLRANYSGNAQNLRLWNYDYPQKWTNQKAVDSFIDCSDLMSQAHNELREQMNRS